MGLNDRDYVRDETQGYTLRAPQSAVGTLIAANVAIYVIDLFAEGALTSFGALSGDLSQLLRHPWQLITYGFLHSQNSITHILFNMLGLWMFGTEMETVYGKREFLRIYLLATVVAGLAWLLSVHFFRGWSAAYLVGASGAITCVTTLFILHFPRRTILLFGAFPMPVWLLGALWIMQDILGARRSIAGAGDGIAYEAHLGGVLFALLYFRMSLNLGRWLPEPTAWSNLTRRLRVGGRPQLKVHSPPGDEAPPPSLDAEVDRLLAKITATGYESLSETERKTLERASSRYQRRRT